MKLSDLSPLMARREGGLSYDRFRADPALASLQWPDDVLEQFLFDHGDNAAFVYDYDSIDLREVRWQLETIPAAPSRRCRPERPMPAVSRATPRTWCTGSNFALTRSGNTGKITVRGCAHRS
ncbi:hypothetical protein ACFV8T_44430 [Streptomyces sp. NPDC059832]|uniref:hypothetical protein n=1 Tax=unclassified Streptomyces TaxID=2593676 RepID=UPI003657537D